MADPPLPDSPADQEARSALSSFQPTAALVGGWKGTIATYQGEVSLTLEIKPDGDVHARLGKDLPTLLSRLRLSDNGILEGVMRGTIDTDDVKRRHDQQALGLRVHVSQEVMTGEAIAWSLDSERGSLLTHWVELKKKQGP